MNDITILVFLAGVFCGAIAALAGAYAAIRRYFGDDQ